MDNRRSFIQKMLGASAFFSLQGLSTPIIAADVIDSINSLHQLPLTEAVQNEDLWKRIQAAYSVSKSYINLNNGGVSPQPSVVLAAEQKYLEICNELPSNYIWREGPRNRPILREKLAKLAGCSTDELVLMQNTTEAMNTVMLGLDWNAGDEVIVSKQDYSTVKVGWEQLERRRKIKLKWISLPMPIEDEDQIVAAYTSQFTKKTKLVNITHLINWTGQILPVKAIRRICDAARKLGIFTLVDGAHSFAHLDFKLSELNCDAFATSLHKWLSAPIGTGMLYVRQDQIQNIWSMFPSSADQVNRIEKFEHKGTTSIAREEATHTAIEFFQQIGIELKQARLFYLKNYWVNQLKDEARLQFYTSFDAQYSGAIALFDVKEEGYKKLSTVLSKKHRIHHTNSETEGARGLRISPNLYTSLDDLDRLVEGIQGYLKS